MQRRGKKADVIKDENKSVVFTSFSFSYLSRARLLARSIKLYNANLPVVALIVDEFGDLPQENIDLSDFDNVIYAKDLRIRNFNSWIFKHDVVEACTAVKGMGFKYLFKMGYQKVIYLDPDIATFKSLDDIISMMNNYSIILTPHQIKPNEHLNDIVKFELTSQKLGIFNLGFLAVSNTKTGIEFVNWWTSRLLEQCYAEPGSGIFTDQKWCDLVPVFFESVHILRHEGCNVASWNLSTRHLKFDEYGNLFVNKYPLVFFHFTKLGREGELAIDKFIESNIELYELWAWYKKTLDTIDNKTMPIGYWYYNTFINGHKINKHNRILYRNREDLQKLFKDPFSEKFFTWCENNEYYEIRNEGLHLDFSPI